MGDRSRPRRADVIASYDLGVEGYEQLWGPVILPAALAIVPWLGLTERSVVVDVGAGTGAVVPSLRSAAPGGLVLGVDASAEMLRIAHVQRGVPVIQGDALALPLAPESVDAVVLAYVLFHLADPFVALEEAVRVLRPGGRIGTATWAWERAGRAQLIWNDALDESGIPPVSPRKSDAGLDSEQAMTRLLRAACLTTQRVWSHRLRHQWDAASFWELATGSGVNRQRLAVLQPDARRVALEHLQTRLKQLPPEDYSWEGEVICAVASKHS